MKLVVATHNPHKVEEFARILAPLGIETSAASDHGFHDEVEETGTTFAENARLKAKAVCEALQLPAVADDSGLCVDALDGAPGVYSARFGGEELPYDKKIELLLQKLDGLEGEGRGAHFTSAICLVWPDGGEISVEGHSYGVIGDAPRGENGFGYDPVFYVKGKSFAQLSGSEKDAISHRGRALRLFAEELTKEVEDRKSNG